MLPPSGPYAINSLQLNASLQPLRERNEPECTGNWVDTTESSTFNGRSISTRTHQLGIDGSEITSRTPRGELTGPRISPSGCVGGSGGELPICGLVRMCVSVPGQLGT